MLVADSWCLYPCHVALGHITTSMVKSTAGGYLALAMYA